MARITYLSVFQIVDHSCFLYIHLLSYFNICGMGSPTNSQHSSVAPHFMNVLLLFESLHDSRPMLVNCVVYCFEYEPIGVKMGTK